MSNTIERPDGVTLGFCDICDNFTPQAEVFHLDIVNDESWSESECKYCFDDSLEWEDRYS